MGDPKNPKVRLQWQDGVGNMLILVEDGNQDKKTVRLADVDVGWAVAVAGLVVFIIFALFMMARCRLSMFTRRRKKILRTKKSVIVKEKKDDKPKVAEVKKVMAISASNKDQVKTVTKEQTKKDLIINMIDSALDSARGEFEADTENINCSCESIDHTGEEQMLRRASGVSLALSLVFDKESDRPVFVKHKGTRGHI
eukprot:TRINITY_DN3358_c0_g1_i1.p1 TRINITY_DN3358_c0_g1~~TRINITY_DN3358_c0_g1_i1.p1  ORF type:complete len:197 (-),score=78.51 TRINITY_DN3358_c0_g1_i1:115-705(-)